MEAIDVDLGGAPEHRAVSQPGQAPVEGSTAPVLDPEVGEGEDAGPAVGGHAGGGGRGGGGFAALALVPAGEGRGAGAVGAVGLGGAGWAVGRAPEVVRAAAG